jgi:hypothetical protein
VTLIEYRSGLISLLSLDARRAFTGPYSDDWRRHFSSAPRSHLLVVRTRPQTERATDSAIRTQGARSLRRTAVNRTPLWMRLPAGGRWHVARRLESGYWGISWGVQQRLAGRRAVGNARWSAMRSGRAVNYLRGDRAELRIRISPSVSAVG